MIRLSETGQPPRILSEIVEKANVLFMLAFLGANCLADEAKPAQIPTPPGTPERV